MEMKKIISYCRKRENAVYGWALDLIIGSAALFTLSLLAACFLIDVFQCEAARAYIHWLAS